MDKDFYNESSANKLGWEPEWFGCDGFDDDLVDAVKDVGDFVQDDMMVFVVPAPFG